MNKIPELTLPKYAIKYAIYFVIGIVSVIFLRPFVIINPGERGVVTRLGQVQGQPLGEGLHFKLPIIDRITRINVRINKDQVPGNGSSKDLQDVDIDVAINWKVTPDKVGFVFQELRDEENALERVLIPAVNEVVKAATAQKTAEEIITKRAELKSDIDVGLRERLAAYGLTLTDVSITNIEFSEQFTQAIEAKQVAEQKAKQAVFIAKEAEQQAQAKINLAKGDAEAQRLQAETLKAQGGELFLKKEAIEAWKSGGAQMPQVLVTAGDSNSIPEFILDLKNQKK